MSLDARGLINRLPPFPENIIKLMVALRQDYVEPEELEVHLIACPVIAGRVLNLANSSFYGFARQIGTLREACIILGQQTLKNLVYSLAVMERFQRPPVTTSEMELPLVARIWRCSLFNACGVASLTRFAQVHLPEAFTAALFENLGLIVVEYFEPDQCAQIFHEADIENVTLQQTMLRQFDCGPALLSMHALTQWQFPQGVCEILQALGSGQSSQGAAMIRFSHLLAKSLGEELSPGIWPEMPRAHDFDYLRRLLPRLPEVIDHWLALFEQLGRELL